MLSQIEEGKIFLEDVNARVELDLSECQSPNGLFTEGCVVLVEGEMVDDRLRVHVSVCECVRVSVSVRRRLNARCESRL